MEWQAAIPPALFEEASSVADEQLTPDDFEEKKQIDRTYRLLERARANVDAKLKAFAERMRQ